MDMQSTPILSFVNTIDISFISCGPDNKKGTMVKNTHCTLICYTTFTGDCQNPVSAVHELNYRTTTLLIT